MPTQLQNIYGENWNFRQDRTDYKYIFCSDFDLFVISWTNIITSLFPYDTANIKYYIIITYSTISIQSIVFHFNLQKCR